MEEDRTFLGEGPYPVTGPLAILARVTFLGAVAAIVIAVFLPSHLVPDFVHSTHLQHFAAFYVATLLGLAAMARTSITGVALRFFVFASLLEIAHFFSGAPWRPLFDNWASDVGGLAAAIAPIAVARFRRRLAARR